MNAVMRITAVVAMSLISLFYTTGAYAQSTDDMLTQYIASANSNMPPNLNATALANLFSVDGVQAHRMGLPPNTGNPIKGRDEMKEFYSRFNDVFSDWTHIETKRTIQERHAVWEGVAKGTHKSTGKSLIVPIVFSIEFNDEGFVVAMDVYINSSQMVEQSK